jgi:hypothetical protein
VRTAGECSGPKEAVDSPRQCGEPRGRDNHRETREEEQTHIRRDNAAKQEMGSVGRCGISDWVARVEA